MRSCVVKAHVRYKMRQGMGGGGIAQTLVYLFPDPAAPCSNNGFRVFSLKISDVAVFIDCTLLMQWAVISLIKLIEPN